MLNRVEVRNRRDDSISFPFQDFDNGFGIAEIEGLDPVEAIMVSSGFAGHDGEQYYSSKRAKRNIVIKFELIPDFANTTAKSLRAQLYRFLMPKKEVVLRFHDDFGSYVDIVGRVETLKAPLFTSDPTATASILCFDPDFFDPVSLSKSGATVAGSDVTTKTTINYFGSVETGILFKMKPTKPLSSFSIIQQAPSGTYQLDFAESLQVDDMLIISTISGSLGASLTRQGTVSSVLKGISPQSKWLELEGPGDNEFRVTSNATGVPWTIEYVTRHGGL